MVDRHETTKNNLDMKPLTEEEKSLLITPSVFEPIISVTGTYTNVDVIVPNASYVADHDSPGLPTVGSPIPPQNNAYTHQVFVRQISDDNSDIPVYVNFRIPYKNDGTGLDLWVYTLVKRFTDTNYTHDNTKRHKSDVPVKPGSGTKDLFARIAIGNKMLTIILIVLTIIILIMLVVFLGAQTAVTFKSI